MRYTLYINAQWTGREDTRFELAHFERRRSGKDRQEDILEQAEQADLKWHVDLVNNNGKADRHLCPYTPTCSHFA